MGTKQTLKSGKRVRGARTKGEAAVSVPPVQPSPEAGAEPAQGFKDDADFALRQIAKCTAIGDAWVNAATDATLEDLMSVAWAVPAALFFVGYQLAELRKALPPASAPGDGLAERPGSNDEPAATGHKPPSASQGGAA
jgi:hypothetical protein